MIDQLKPLFGKFTNFARNRIRHKIMPEVLQVNKGIRSTIRKKLIETYL